MEGSAPSQKEQPRPPPPPPPPSLHPPSSLPLPPPPLPPPPKPQPPSPDIVLVNISGTKYSVVSLVAENLGMALTEENSDDCDLYWTDAGIGTERFLALKHYQYLNHFPGMSEISRKDSLGRNMERLRKLHKEEYNFVPRTWVLPSDYHSLSYQMREYKRRRKNKTFIIKPHNSAMGNGISLTRSIDDVHKEQNVVVQEYLDKPFLLDGFKIDLRVYVLVTSCNPLRVFVYRDGLVRFSTQPYIPPSDTNLDQHFMHLTNYSINKHSDAFDSSEETDRGSKRTLQFLNNWLSHHSYNVAELWAKIYDIVVKTLLVTSPHLVHAYQACRPGRGPDERSQFFEILGFDIFLDDQLNPWLLEVNRSPSFGTDSKLDLDVKTGVLRDALRLFSIKPCNKKREMVASRVAVRRRLIHSPSKFSRYDFLAEQEAAAYDVIKKKKEIKDCLGRIRRERDLLEHEQQNMGGYVRVYPCIDWAKDKLYRALLQSASMITIIGEKTPRRCRGTHRESVFNKMKEHELLDLLSQYEDEEKPSPHAGGVAPNSIAAPCPSATMYHHHHHHHHHQSATESRSPMDSVYKAMASRVAEEEQTQRIMIALNDMKPAYPGKTSSDLKAILDEINSAIEKHTPRLANFWLEALDKKQRRQLLFPLKHNLSSLLSHHWRTDSLENIRLYQIFKKLFNFLLSFGGRGLWASFVPKEKSWEEMFKERSSVISVTEMVCCRRIVELSQATVKAAFYYHHLHPTTTNTNNRARHQRHSTIPQSHPHSLGSLTALPSIRKPPPPPSLKHYQSAPDHVYAGVLAPPTGHTPRHHHHHHHSVYTATQMKRKSAPSGFPVK